VNDITYLFAYTKNNLPDLNEWAKSQNLKVSREIVADFMKYGWSFDKLLNSNTKVMRILKPYFPPKRPHTDNGLGDYEPQYKRRRDDQSEASTSLPDHDLPANSLKWFDRNRCYPDPSCNIVESISGSNFIHPISFNAKNRTRDLIDPATASNLSYTINNPDESIHPTTADSFLYTINSLYKFTDPVTTSYLGYTINSLYKFADPITTSYLGYAINSPDEITTDFLQSADDRL